MKIFLHSLFFFLAITGYTQKTIDVGKEDVKISPGNFYTIGEQLVATAKYVKVVEGSPYFRETWMRGMVTLSKGSRYDSILLRLDLLDNSLQFINLDGKEMIVTSPVRAIILHDSVTGKKYEFDNSVFLPVTNKIETGWYQLLADGQVALYKRMVKTLKENQPYGSATVEQTISDATQYYIFANSVFTRVKKMKDIPVQLNDKKEELNKYISVKKLSGHSDADYASVVDYYNSLIEK